MLNFLKISKKVPNSTTFRLNFSVRYKYWNAPSNLPLPYFNASQPIPFFSMSVLNGLEEYIYKVTNSTTSCWCNRVWCNRVWQGVAVFMECSNRKTVKKPFSRLWKYFCAIQSWVKKDEQFFLFTKSQWKYRLSNALTVRLSKRNFENTKEVL